MGRRVSGWAMVMSAWLGVGCASAPVSNGTQAAPDPQVMYPLRVGNAWSYDVDTGERSTTLAVTRVEAREGDEVMVRTGEAVVRYRILPEGVQTVTDGAWLFRTPFAVGAEWPSPGGRDARIVATDSVASTPAGSFEGCLDVLETGGKLELEVRTVYCPGVGPVLVESTMRSNVSERRLTVTAKLRGYQVNPP